MDGIDLLRQHALLKRNAAILAAKRDYQTALKEIRKLQSRLNYKRPGRPRKATGENVELKATTVAREILREGRPMSLTELTIAVQRTGCRILDDPRIVARNIESGLRYYSEEFRRDGEGRWGVTA